jgi:predicted TIM-barrel fold metal-dependent hydrolase
MTVLSKPVGYPLFDADNHYYEPVDMFVEYIEPEYADRTFTIAERDGETVALFDGRPVGFIGGSGSKRRIRPGALRAQLRGELSDAGDDEDDSYASDPAARIELMDRQGIEATLIFPSTGVTLANVIGQDPELLAAHMRAFNRWLLETWSFDFEHRIIAPAVIELADADAAVAELDRVLDQGARAIQILPGPALWATQDALGRSPADPVYDPLWARVNEARVLVCLHLGNSGYMEHYSADWGENPDPEGVRSDPGAQGGIRMPDHGSLGRSAFQWTMLYRDRPIMETIAILIYHNLFGRFPDIRVASVENGSIWVPYLLRAMDNMKGMGRNGPWPNGYVKGRPSEVFRNHVYVSPHHYGEDIGALVDLLGVEHVLFGSDFPHAEGMSGVEDYQERAGEFADKLGHPPDTTRRIMRDNGMRLLGLSES